MNRPRRIPRFPRRQTDAHLLTPPDTSAIMYHRTVEDWEIRNQTHNRYPLSSVLAAEFNFRDHPPLPFVDTARSLIQAGHADRIDTFEENHGCTFTIRITRRPKLSPKLLANLTPLQRQRLRP